VRIGRLTLFTAVLITLAGCQASSHTDVGRGTREMQRNGWAIHLDNVGAASVTDSDWGTTVDTGGHKVVIGDGVAVDGRQVSNARSGDVRVTNNSGAVSVTVDGKPVELK